MPNAIYIALIPLLPLAGFLLLGLFGKKIFKQYSGLIGTMLMLFTAGLSCWLAYGYFFEFGRVDGIYQKLIPFQYRWLEFSKEMSINMGVLLDPIAAMMIVVVSFVSLMVHVYSLSYMKGEERFPIYYAYLSLFSFSMLGLVLASNIFQTYIFWELVGISSYLLIGFYYDRPGAVAAAKKAFIVTRFADLGFLIGILILSFYSGTLDFNTLIVRLSSPGSEALNSALSHSFLGISALSWGAALIFMGGAGKSAMFPLHVWLPDAMEGPTPVSALIHAATMVVAGVFLVARLFPVFAISAHTVLDLVAYVGVISAALAAIIACTQTDIKRVLAYSTMSQIGFMMFAIGSANYGGEQGLGFTASMFHLFTHAMFKALLFLAAGAVIHYVHSNEMSAMGGLRKKLPVTHITFLVACLSIAGFPPFAGFFSKEEILLAAQQHHQVIYWIALVTSGLTAFYMFRLYFNIFWNRLPAGSVPDSHTHGEGGWTILLPLILLAAGAAFAGFIPFGHFVSSDGAQLNTPFHPEFALLPVLFGLAGIFLAMWLYGKQNDRSDRFVSSVKGAYRFAYHKFYVDEVYLFVTKKLIFNLVGKPAAWIDKNVVDGLVNATGYTTQVISDKIKGIQSGKVQAYAIYFLAGAIGLALLFIYG